MEDKKVKSTKTKSTSSKTKTTSGKGKSTTKSTVVKSETLKKEVPTKEVKMTKEVSKSSVRSIDSMKSVMIVVVAFLLIAVGALYAFLRAKENGTAYSDAWKDKSYLVEKEYAASVRCDGLSNAILGEEAFVFVTSYSEEEFELEKKMAKLIRENHIQDFYVYSLEDNCGPITDASSVAGQNLLLNQGLTHVPAILYYRDGALVEVIEREDEKMLEVGDFQQLLDMYEISK